MILKIFGNNFPSFPKWFSKTSELPLKILEFFPKCSLKFSEVIIENFGKYFRYFSKYFLKFPKILHKIFERSIQYLLKYVSENTTIGNIAYDTLLCTAHALSHTICVIAPVYAFLFKYVCFYIIRHHCILHIQYCM